MTLDELKRAQDKAKELIDFETKTQRIREFIDTMKESEYLRIVTAHQVDMWYSEKEVYQLVGQELIDILERKYAARVDFIRETTASDLIAP